MKAKDVIDPTIKEQTEVSEKSAEVEIQPVEKLNNPVSRDEFKEGISKRFDIADRSGEFITYADSLEITTNEALVIAENKSSEINTILKNIERVRKAVKQPFIEAGKIIEEHAKTLALPYEEAKEKINDAITGFKSLQEAQALADKNKIEAELKKKEDEKNKEKEFVDRVCKQINARIFGGTYLTSKGEAKQSAGANSLAELNAMTELIKNNVPKPETFVYFKEVMSDFYKLSLNNIKARAENIKNIENQDVTVRKEAVAKMEKDRVQSEIKSATIVNKADEQINKEITQDKKDVEKIVSESGKGLRKTVKFTVDDKLAVPEKYKIVDERLVNDYLGENKEKVLQAIQDGEILISGITFYIDENYVSR